MEMPRYYVGILVSIIIFGLLVTIHPVLAVIQLLYIPLAVYPVRKMMKSIDTDVNSVVKSNAEISQLKGDIFQAIEFIKLSCLEDRKLSEIDAKNQHINKVWGRLSALDSLSGIWTTGFVTVLFTGITFSIGIMLMASDVIHVGQLVSCITYVGILYAHINAALQMSIRKRKEEVEYGKSFSYLTLSGEEDENTGKKDFEFSSDIIVHGLSYSYDGKPVLNNLDLTIGKGKWIGLTGPSGSGKSTLLDLLMKLYPVDDGMISIDGTDLNEFNSFSLRRNITKVTQDIYLFPGTIAENMRLMNENLTDAQLIDALEFASLGEWFRNLQEGLNTDVGEMGKLMSGGEKQRLSIAMGYLRGSSVYLLDEITSALDENNERIIAENFKKLQGNGCTIVSVTHDPSFMVYADEMYEMNDGKAIRLN